jgi:hypothetical protein
MGTPFRSQREAHRGADIIKDVIVIRDIRRTSRKELVRCFNRNKADLSQQCVVPTNLRSRTGVLCCRCPAAAAAAAVVQVHDGNAEAAEAAKQQLQWKQMITLTVEALRMPQLWFFSVSAFLWGECVHWCHTYPRLLFCVLNL